MLFIPLDRDNLSFNLEPLTGMFIMNIREKKTKKSIAFFYTNSAHVICVCLQSTEITADYPSYTAKVIEKKFGGLCMFAPGTIGDQHPREFDRGYQAAEEMGLQLAGELIKAQKKMKYSTSLSINSIEKEFDLPKDKKAKNSDGSYLRTRLSVMTLNDIALCFWPGEAFSMITKKIYRNSPFKKTYLVGNTDDFKNYFLFKKEYLKLKYDTRIGMPWEYDYSAGDMMYELDMELLAGAKQHICKPSWRYAKLNGRKQL